MLRKIQFKAKKTVNVEKRWGKHYEGENKTAHEPSDASLLLIAGSVEGFT